MPGSLLATAERLSLAMVCYSNRIELYFDINRATLEPSFTFMTMCAHACSTLEHLQNLSLHHTQHQAKAKYQPLSAGVGDPSNKLGTWVAPWEHVSHVMGKYWV